MIAFQFLNKLFILLQIFIYLISFNLATIHCRNVSYCVIIVTEASIHFVLRRGQHKQKKVSIFCARIKTFHFTLFSTVSLEWNMTNIDFRASKGFCHKTIFETSFRV